MDPTNKAHSDDLTLWDDEEICALTANALPPLPDFNTHRDSSQGNHQLAIGLSSSSSSSEPRGETRDYRFYSIPEIELLITAVSLHGRKWKEIVRFYFNDSGRTDMQLKEKWRDMLRDAEKQIDTTRGEHGSGWSGFRRVRVGSDLVGLGKTQPGTEPNHATLKELYSRAKDVDALFPRKYSRT